MNQDAGRPEPGYPSEGASNASLNADWRSRLGDALFLAMLFLLLIGRIEIGESFKVGGKIENLFPLLLVARWLERRPLFAPFSVALSPFRFPCLLLLGGMLIGSIYHLSEEGLEELGRYALQVSTGVYLAVAIVERLSGKPTWAWAWLVGLAILQIRTPWGQLDQTDLEGPLGHRNLQATFYLLTLPLLYIAARTVGWEKNWKRLLSGGIVVSEIAFMLISKSRSGLLGFVVAGVLGFSHWARYRKPGDRHFPLAAFGFLCVAVVMTSAMLPRLWAIGRELTDPYHLTRTGIWSAAVEGFQQPDRWLTGVGMGHGYFWTIQESSMGNLNHRYRRGHHPHSLYLMWVYWGGVLSLIGWIWLLFNVIRFTFDPDRGWELRLVGICLLGYAAIEIVETTMLNPKIATLFWINLSLLAALKQAQPSANESGPN